MVHGGMVWRKNIGATHFVKEIYGLLDVFLLVFFQNNENDSLINNCFVYIFIWFLSYCVAFRFCLNHTSMLTIKFYFISYSYHVSWYTHFMWLNIFLSLLYKDAALARWVSFAISFLFFGGRITTFSNKQKFYWVQMNIKVIGVQGFLLSSFCFPFGSLDRCLKQLCTGRHWL